MRDAQQLQAIDWSMFDNAGTETAELKGRRPMFTMSIHEMRIEAHSRNGHVWLDLLPEGQTSMYPRLTVFIETENLLALRRELDEIAGTLASGARSVEDVPAERLTA